jgi:hypothetical protein
MFRHDVAMAGSEPRRPRDLMDVLIDHPHGGGPGEDDDAYALPASPVSWRARRNGRALALALAGVAFGFVLLVVPGVFALREVRDWRAGHTYRPRLAWALGGAGLWVCLLAPLLASDLSGLALVLGIVALPVVVRVAARP